MGEEKGREATLRVEVVCLDELVPADDRYRRLDEFSTGESCASGGALLRRNLGRPSIDPIVLLKLMLAGALEGVRLDARAAARRRPAPRSASLPGPRPQRAPAGPPDDLRRPHAALRRLRPLRAPLRPQRGALPPSTACSTAATSRSTASTPRPTPPCRACAPAWAACRRRKAAGSRRRRSRSAPALCEGASAAASPRSPWPRRAAGARRSARAPTPAPSRAATPRRACAASPGSVRTWSSAARWRSIPRHAVIVACRGERADGFEGDAVAALLDRARFQAPEAGLRASPPIAAIAAKARLGGGRRRGHTPTCRRGAASCRPEERRPRPPASGGR